MAAPPKYAFITLDQGMSKRDAFLALSQYGDVRLVSKISEVSSIVNDLVRNLEDEMGEAKKVYVSTAPVVVEPRPVRITRRCLPGMGDSPPISNGSLLGKRKHNDPPMSEPVFRSAPARHQPSLSLPTFGTSLGEGLSPMQQLHQSLFKKEGEMIADIKTEEIDDGYIHDVNQPFDSLEEAEAAMGMAYDDDDEPSTSGHFDGEPADLDNFIDDEGNIEVPYAPNFKECKTARRDSHQPKPVEKAEQARCEVCRRWVKCTETLSRLISHVFIHAKKQRFVCPVDGCEYSNRTESTARRHIDNNHDGVASPIDSEKDKKSQSEVWKAGRSVWAPRCFPDHFERAPGGNLFMRINEKSVLME